MAILAVILGTALGGHPAVGHGMRPGSSAPHDRLQTSIAAEDLGASDVAVIAVNGLSCISCANRVHSSLLAPSGVVMAEVDLGHGTVSICYRRDRIDACALVQAVAAAGDARHHYSAAAIAPAAEPLTSPSGSAGKRTRKTAPPSSPSATESAAP